MPAEYGPHELMRELLELSGQRWVDPDRFRQMATRLGLARADQRIYFLTQLREKVRLIPLKLYAAVETREKMLDALQQAMDLEISQEESAL